MGNFYFTVTHHLINGTFRWFGQEKEYNVLVMDLLGPSLEDLFNFCGRRFTMKTVLMVADQVCIKHSIDMLIPCTYVILYCSVYVLFCQYYAMNTRLLYSLISASYERQNALNSFRSYWFFVFLHGIRLLYLMISVSMFVHSFPEH